MSFHLNPRVALLRLLSCITLQTFNSCFQSIHIFSFEGAVRKLPNGNYVLAGANTDRHLMLGKSKNTSPGFKSKNQNRAAGSSLMAGNRPLPPPTLVKMNASATNTNKRRFSGIVRCINNEHIQQHILDTSETPLCKGKKGRKPTVATVTSIPQRARPVSQRKVSCFLNFDQQDFITILSEIQENSWTRFLGTV